MTPQEAAKIRDEATSAAGRLRERLRGGIFSERETLNLAARIAHLERIADRMDEKTKCPESAWTPSDIDQRETQRCN